jgi:hypothetical protein
MESVWISWEDGTPVQYDFESMAEMNAFLTGLAEGLEHSGQNIEQFDSATGYAEKYGTNKDVDVEPVVPVPEWPPEMQLAAQKQGWDIFNCDGGEVDNPELPNSRHWEIEGLTEWPDQLSVPAGDPPFHANDSAAIAFVNPSKSPFFRL